MQLGMIPTMYASWRARFRTQFVESADSIASNRPLVFFVICAATTNVLGPSSPASRQRFQMPCRRILPQWRRFLQDLCAPPAVPLAPAPSTAHPSAPISADLDDAMSQAEVEKALPKLANGRAAGREGWPAELPGFGMLHTI